MIQALIPRLALVAALAAAVPAAHAQAAPEASAGAGEKKAAMCLGCHNIPGYQASFPIVHKVPKIGGQTEPYIVAALNAYKKGDRKHPSMRAIAGSLTDQDMADLAKFYAAQGGAAPAAEATAAPADVTALLQKGACASCHGPNYNTPIDKTYPKLAGQHADFLLVALRAYGTAGSAQLGRNNAIMSAQIKAFKPAELKAIADYLATLPGDLRTVPESRIR